MRPTFKLSDRSTPVSTLKTICTQLRPNNITHKRLSTLAFISMTALTSLGAQAALPQAIQAALLRADITPDDISIIITPVGDKATNRLPPIIKVVDNSADGNSKSNSEVNNPNPVLMTTVSSSSNDKPQATSTTTNTAAANNRKKDSTFITVDKKAIQQQERQLHAYTDDPYTYQSLESMPSILANNAASTLRNNSSSGSDNGDSDVDNRNATTAPSAMSLLPPLLSHQPDIPRTPASTMKLVPSFIALDTLGANFVWHTRVYHTGIIVGNRLHGNLIIQGAGDPKMTHERLQQLLYRVQKAGIRHINGDIIIDSAVFKNVSKNPATFDNAPLRSYNASPDGFLVNFSSVGIKSYPLDNSQAQLTYTPQLTNYQLPKIVDTRSAYCGQANYSLAPQWQKEQLALKANLPESCGEHLFYIAYPDAKDFAAALVTSKWQALGNTLSGQVISQETPYRSINNVKSRHGLAALSTSPLPFISYPSLSLTQQIYDINHFSNNVMTEQVALSIGAYNKATTAQSDGTNTNGNKASDTSDNRITRHKATSLYQFGQPTITSYPDALRTINQWWQTHLTTPPPYLTNGSGLCRDCTISAANLSELLTYAYSHPSFGAYVNSLGIAGVSGTITAHSERLPESTAIGRAWIKTGTLNNVTSMAGYVKGQSGQDYVVVGLINTKQALNPYTARPVLDTMLDWTAQH